VCGEPWDAYGVYHHEDMTPKEANAFLKGLGCPCCKGRRRGRSHEYDREFLTSLVDPANTDEDPIELLEQVEVDGVTWDEYVGD